MKDDPLLLTLSIVYLNLDEDKKISEIFKLSSNN